MSNIHQALGHLFKRIEDLEITAQQCEQAVKDKVRTANNAAAAARKAAAGAAPDLFNAAPVPAAAQNVHVIDPALLARKLDSAIQKVEQILQEGQA